MMTRGQQIQLNCVSEVNGIMDESEGKEWGDREDYSA